MDAPFRLQVKLLVPGARAPQPGKLEDGGYDLWSIEDHTLPPLTSCLFKCGFATAFPAGWVAIIRDRSSMGIKGLMHRAGVLDSGYRGEWMVSVYNSGREVITIESVIRNPNAKAAAQVLFIPYGKVLHELVDELPASLRGINWNGSTDVHSNPQG